MSQGFQTEWRPQPRAWNARYRAHFFKAGVGPLALSGLRRKGIIRQLCGPFLAALRKKDWGGRGGHTGVSKGKETT